MSNWFYNPGVQFNMWDISHIGTIFIIFVLVFSIFIFRKTLIPYRRIIRLTFGWILIISRISLDIWYIKTGTWDIRSSLPLELCSIASLVCAVMLLTKSRQLFEVFYFI